jgi:aldehyde dehydrogenase (NAD+)
VLAADDNAWLDPSGVADRHFVGGEWSRSGGDRIFRVINPATEELYLEAVEVSAADVDRAVAAARSAFDLGPWPRMTPQARAAYLNTIADGIANRATDFGHAWTSQTGALASSATAFSASLADVMRGFAALAVDFPFIERHPTTSGARMGLRVREPVGVVAAIIPWNAPLMLIVMKLAPALLAGCTVVIKSSPEAPAEAYLLADIVEKAGLPAGVVNVITADRELSERLVRHPGVDKVSFTGSSAAGRRIASICGERLARVTLELGGKSPAVVLDDCEPEVVAAGLVPVVTMMAGQTCAALTRVIVTRHRERQVVDAIATRLKRLRVGDPSSPATDVGPVSMQRQRDRVEQYIASGTAEGAKLVIGGGRPRHLTRGFFIEPTLFTNVSNHSRIAREEIFGPVLSVIVVDNEDEAVRVANDSDFGLNASVFTKDGERALAVARQLRTGTVGHNGYLTDFEIGFGGFKQSGIGREGGREGVLAYLESKTVLLQAEFPAGGRLG